jgi:hypothetical protein
VGLAIDRSALPSDWSPRSLVHGMPHRPPGLSSDGLSGTSTARAGLVAGPSEQDRSGLADPKNLSVGAHPLDAPSRGAPIHATWDATTSGSGWDDESGVVGFHLTAATQSFERSSSCPATRLAGGQLAVPERPRPVRLGPWRSPACAQCARCDLYKAGSAAQNLPLRCPRAAASRVPAVGPAAARLRHQPTSRGPFARCGL